MRPSLLVSGVLVTGLAVVGMSTRMTAGHPHKDFGSFVQDLLSDHSEMITGAVIDLDQNVMGAYD